MRPLVAVLIMASSSIAFAEPGSVHYGPIASTSPDSGTCGNSWAEDRFDRVFQVDTRANPDGTYDVVERFERGTFVTVAGPSPGGCDTDPGGTVAAGVEGRMQGSFEMIVVGVFNPDAVCTDETCNTTAGFVTTVFGPEATFTVPTFHLHYVAPGHGQWKNASADRGGNRGDITGD